MYVHYVHNASAKIPGKLLWCDPAYDCVACVCKCSVFVCVCVFECVRVHGADRATHTLASARAPHTRFAIMMILIASTNMQHLIMLW